MPRSQPTSTRAPDPTDGASRKRAAVTAALFRPRLAHGVELLGRLEGSAFKQPPFMVRRQDGQMIQLPGLLYGVAERADGRHDHASIAEELTHRIGRGMSAADVGFLIDEKLRPLGILAAPDGSSPRVEKTNPLLGLTWQKALVPDRGVRRITSPFLPLFHPVVAAVAVAAFLALDAWLLFSHGIGQPVRTALYQPAFLLALFAGMVLATAFHESGHATACRYGGARPGVIGGGIYVAWPVFYTDVTDAYRLPRSGRLRTDLGGVYFNAIFGLVVGAAYFATGSEPLLLLAPRAFATAYDSLFIQWDKIRAAFGDDDVVRGLAGSLQILALVTPCA